MQINENFMKNEQSLVSITHQHRYKKSSKLMKQKAVKYIFGQGICCEFNNQRIARKRFNYFLWHARSFYGHLLFNTFWHAWTICMMVWIEMILGNSKLFMNISINFFMHKTLAKKSNGNLFWTFWVWNWKIWVLNFLFSTNCPGNFPVTT